MDTELLGLPAEAGTAIALIASGVIVPAVTAVMAYPGIPTKVKRVLPIVLAAAAAGVIVVLQSGGPVAERLIAWLVVAATVVGIAQAVYAVMPGAWKALERASSSVTGPQTPVSGAPRGQDGTNTPDPVSEYPEEDPGAQSGLESSEGMDGSEPYRQRTLNQPEEIDEDGYPRG